METKEGVENIEEICAVPGLDSIVFGQMVRARAHGVWPWRLCTDEPQSCDA